MLCSFEFALRNALSFKLKFCVQIYFCVLCDSPVQKRNSEFNLSFWPQPMITSTLKSVVKLCCDFLLTEFVQLRFDVQTYCRVWTIADRHGLKDLQEAAEHKMASSMYRDICEKEGFLTHISADQLISLLSRDDLTAPSETFVFKSVMQWIKHKKEERMAVTAKVIGAVRLGLVDIRVVIEELDTEEMQRDPEIHMQLHEALINSNMPSRHPKFVAEKTKPRSMNPVRLEVQFIRETRHHWEAGALFKRENGDRKDKLIRHVLKPEITKRRNHRNETK